MSWSKSIIHWREGTELFVSVPFTWYLPLAKRLCDWNRQAGLYVHVDMGFAMKHTTNPSAWQLRQEMPE